MPPLVCRGHTRPLPSLSFSPLDPDKQHFLLVSSCKDGIPMLRDGATGDWLGSFIGHKGCCWDIKLSSTGHRAISGSADFSAKVWDATDGSCLLTLPHNHIVKSVDLNGDGTKGVTGGYEKKLRLWDIKSLLEQQQATAEGQSQQNGDSSSTITPKASSSASPTALPSKEFVRDDGSSAHDGNIKSVIWDEANNQVISAGEDKAIRFWDPETLKCVHTINTEEPITSLERNHDDKHSISLTHGNTVEFIDPATRKAYLSFKLAYPPSTASIHPIWKDRFVTGSSADGWVRVHSASTGEELEVYKGHHGPVHAISYSPDGELYASGSEDGTIRLWQTTPKTYGLWKYDGEANTVTN